MSLKASREEPATFHRYDPALSPLSSSKITRIHMTSEEVPVCIRPGTVILGWTFDGDIPDLSCMYGKATQ
ncbi:MAG: hypothetical protein M3Y72_15920 [Acidobacteriota bacterium]|nr:hypothetical protein [Acidobacteriota bacterium]